MFVAPRRAATRWHLVPLVAQLRGYTSLRRDVLAGVVIAALAVPQAMAYAQTAGLPVVAGLYGLGAAVGRVCGCWAPPGC